MAELKAAAQRALQLMDFTTLADDDTHERVEKLCADARWAPWGGGGADRACSPAVR